MKSYKTIAIACLLSASAFATDSVVLEDFSYSISGNTAITGTNYIAAFWGTYNAGTFTPTPGANNGFSGLNGTDMTVTLSSTTNTGIIAPGALFAVGFFDITNGSSFASTTPSTARAILTDSNWIAPTFSTSPGITTAASSG
jgi:hypothetical protein